MLAVGISGVGLTSNTKPVGISYNIFSILELAIGTLMLYQGDPLSPYLFVIAMEVFSCLLRRAISGGFLSGWRVRGRSGKGILISHLLFADDTLVFCEESLDQMTYLS